MSDTRIKLIAFDLDGTILTRDKRLTERTVRALRVAADRGIYIVPATGRYFGNIPQDLKNLDFISYAITINGARVVDLRKNRCIYSAEMSCGTGVGIMDFLNDYPVLYAATIENGGYITRSFQERADEYASGYYLQSLRTSFAPVENLKKYVEDNKLSVQKLQFYMKDFELKEKLGIVLQNRFPETVVSSSVNQNIEINDIHANKGEALLHLAEYLGVRPEETMAFGDGGNDISMIRNAGIGVAMENARADLKKIADRIAPDCDNDGVAFVIERILSAAK